MEKSRNFSDSLREYRHRKRLGQAEMGALLGISGKYVGMIERGEKRVKPGSSLAILFGRISADGGGGGGGGASVKEEKNADDPRLLRELIRGLAERVTAEQFHEYLGELSEATAGGDMASARCLSILAALAHEDRRRFFSDGAAKGG